MSSLGKIRTVANRLQSALAGEDAGNELRLLVASYNEYCRTLKNRLSQIDAVLARGKLEDGLQLAELDPPVLDQLTILGFPECAELEEWCLQNGVPFEGGFDTHAIHRLNEAFASSPELDANLNKKYRGAVLRKDFEEALPIIRSIYRIRPDDPEVQRELNNVCRRYGKKLVNGIAEGTENIGITEAQRLLEELESLGLPDLLEHEEVHKTAAKIKKAYAKEAESEIARLLEELPHAPTIEDWPLVEETFDKVTALSEQLTEDLPPRIKERWERLKEDELRLRRESARKNSQEMAMKHLRDLVQQTRNDRLSTGFSSLDAMERRLQNLFQAVERLEATGAEVDEELRGRWNTEVRSLKGGVAEQKRRKRKNVWTLASIGAGVFLLFGTFSTEYIRVKNSTRDADRILETKNRSLGEDFVQRRFSFPAYTVFQREARDNLYRVNAFLEEDQEKYEALLTELAGFDVDFTGLDESERSFAHFHERLDDFEARTADLSRGYVTEVSNLLAPLLDTFDMLLIEKQTEVRRRLEEDLTELEGIISEQLRPTDPPDVLASGIEQVGAELEELEMFYSEWNEVVDFRSGQERRLGALGERLQRERDLVQSHESLLESLRNAGTLEEYFSTAEYDYGVDYPGSLLFETVRQIPDLADLTSVKREMMDFLPQRLGALIGVEELPPVSPETAMTPEELDVYLDFRFNDYGEDIYVSTGFLERSHRVRIYSRGELERDAYHDYGSANYTEVEGVVFVPEESPNVVRFRRDDLEVRNRQELGLSPESELMRNLGLQDYVNESGEVIPTTDDPAPFLRMIDLLLEEVIADVRFRVYSVQQIYRIMTASERRAQWGLHYVPGIDRALADVLACSVRDGDWLLPAHDPELYPRNTNRFSDAATASASSRPAVPFQRQALFNRFLVEGINRADLEYRGLFEGSFNQDWDIDFSGAEPYLLFEGDDDSYWDVVSRASDPEAKPLDFSPVIELRPSLTDIVDYAALQAGLSRQEKLVMIEFLNIERE